MFSLCSGIHAKSQLLAFAAGTLPGRLDSVLAGARCVLTPRALPHDRPLKRPWGECKSPAGDGRRALSPGSRSAGSTGGPVVESHAIAGPTNLPFLAPAGGVFGRPHITIPIDDGFGPKSWTR